MLRQIPSCRRVLAARDFGWLMPPTCGDIAGCYGGSLVAMLARMARNCGLVWLRNFGMGGSSRFVGVVILDLRGVVIPGVIMER